MTTTDVAALLAICAALCLAIGDVFQQRSASAVTDKAAGDLALFVTLVRSRQWWTGTGVAMLGFALQAAALGLGSVLLVQALLVCSLLFALPIEAALNHRRVTARQWMWAVLLAVGVAVLVTVGNPEAGHSRASPATWAWIAVVAGPVLALCVLGARLSSGPVPAVLLALTSGSLWGLLAVLTKSVIDRMDQGLWGLLQTPELYGWTAVFLGAAAWQQSSFHAGSLTASLPTMTVTEPIVSIVLGIVVLGETLDAHGPARIVLWLAGAVTVLATGVLARSEAAAETPATEADTSTE